MTAAHVCMLEEVFRWFKTGSGSAPMVIEQSVDTSNLVTRSELKALMTAAIPRAVDMTPQIQMLKGEVMALRDHMASSSHAMLAAPAGTGETVDATARNVLELALARGDDMDQRLRAVEAVIDTMRLMTEMRAAGQAA